MNPESIQAQEEAYISDLPELEDDKNPKIKKFFKYKKKKKELNMTKGRFDLAIQLTWITPALVFVALFTVYAIFIVFKDGLNAHTSYQNFLFSFKNFKGIFTDTSFTKSILNSVLYVFISIPLSVLIALITAKCLSNLQNKKFFGFMQSIYFLPYVTSGVAIAMAFSMIFSNNSNSLFAQLVKAFGGKTIDWTKPGNALALLLMFGMWKNLPFKIIMFTAAFTAVDKKLYQAASIDGMKKWKQFWSISIPQIMPIILYIFTTSIIGAFKWMPLGLYPDYATAEASGAQTMVYYIFNQVTYVHNYGRGGAASITLMLIILAITITNASLTTLLKKKYK